MHLLNCILFLQPVYQEHFCPAIRFSSSCPSLVLPTNPTNVNCAPSFIKLETWYQTQDISRPKEPHLLYSAIFQSKALLFEQFCTTAVISFWLYFFCLLSYWVRWDSVKSLKSITDLLLLLPKVRWTVIAWNEFGLIWFSWQIHVGCNLPLHQLPYI